MDKRFEKIAVRVATYDNMYRSLNDFSTIQKGLMPGETEVWYSRNPTFGAVNSPTLSVDANNISNTHVLLGKIADKNIGNIYAMMQEDKWSPNGEANEFISSKNLNHVSMGLGDVIVVDGRIFVVDRVGFSEIVTNRSEKTRSNILNGSNRQKAMKMLYDFFVLNRKGVFQDDDWKSVYDVLRLMSGQGIVVEMVNNCFKEDDNGITVRKVWEFRVNYQNDVNHEDVIFCTLTAYAQGTAIDPFEKYAIGVELK